MVRVSSLSSTVQLSAFHTLKIEFMARTERASEWFVPSAALFLHPLFLGGFLSQMDSEMSFFSPEEIDSMRKHTCPVACVCMRKTNRYSKYSRRVHIEIVRNSRDGYRHYGIAAKVGTLGRVNPVRLDFD